MQPMGEKSTDAKLMQVLKNHKIILADEKIMKGKQHLAENAHDSRSLKRRSSLFRFLLLAFSLLPRLESDPVPASSSTLNDLTIRS